MGAAIEIARKDHTAAMLRGLAAKATGGAPVRRLLALTARSAPILLFAIATAKSENGARLAQNIA